MVITLPGILLAVAAQASGFEKATDPPAPAYDFSRPQSERITLAESAAPPEVSSKATVYVLEQSGYVKIREGSNGFSCLVDRQTPLNQEPTCFDAEGSATTLLTRLAVEKLRSEGSSEAEIAAELKRGYESGRFSAPRRPGIVYMLSEATYVYVASANRIVQSPPHLMFYAPYATDNDIGSPTPAIGQPRILRAGQPDAYIIVFPRSR